MRRRVVITGMGVVTSLGESVPEMWENLCAGRSGIKRVARWDASAYATQIGAECTHFNPKKHGMDSREARRLDRFAQFAIAASRQAVVDSGIDMQQVDRDRAGVLIGSGIGGIETLEEQSQILFEKGPTRISPFTVPRLMVNAASGNVSILYNLRGPTTAVATACATGANAIGDAGALIRMGMADIMIAGGSEAALCKLGVGSFSAARAMSTRNDEPEKASRPWDKNRDGFVMGEGAGVLVLEEYEHARKRGARMYAELVGYDMTADAYHITATIEDGSGAAKAMLGAIRDAGMAPEDVDYINAHGTSTPIGDPAEVNAIKAAFGSSARKVHISSTKSMLGHLLGATGGVETVITALAVHHDIIPPTINLDEPDLEAGCDLDFTPHKAREARVRAQPTRTCRVDARRGFRPHTEERYSHEHEETSIRNLGGDGHERSGDRPAARVTTRSTARFAFDSAADAAAAKLAAAESEPNAAPAAAEQPVVADAARRRSHGAGVFR
jgi:3-oxoacyl-[acyl-carrier-protein] synthase II